MEVVIDKVKPKEDSEIDLFSEKTLTVYLKNPTDKTPLKDNGDFIYIKIFHPESEGFTAALSTTSALQGVYGENNVITNFYKLITVEVFGISIGDIKINSENSDKLYSNPNLFWIIDQISDSINKAKGNK